MRYLHDTVRVPENRLAQARADRAKWESLRPEEQRRFVGGPIEAPISGLIGLCQTVAFIARNLPNHKPTSAISI